MGPVKDKPVFNNALLYSVHITILQITALNMMVNVDLEITLSICSFDKRSAREHYTMKVAAYQLNHFPSSKMISELLALGICVSEYIKKIGEVI